MTEPIGFFLWILLCTVSAPVQYGREPNFFKIFQFLVYKPLLSVLVGRGQNFRIAETPAPAVAGRP